MTPHRVTIEGWFSVLVPADWSWSEAEGLVSLYGSNGGAGAVNASLFFRPGTGPAAQAELSQHALELVQSLGATPDPAAVQTAVLDGAPASYVECEDDTGDHWRAWHAARDGRLVLLAYNCPAAEAGRERAQVDRIVQSFRWEAPRPHPDDC